MTATADSPYREEIRIKPARKLPKECERLIRRACFYSAIESRVNDPDRLNAYITESKTKRAARKRNQAIDELRRYLLERTGE